MDKLEIAVYIWGPVGGGKTHTLMRLSEFLRQLGFDNIKFKNQPVFNLPKERTYIEGLTAEKRAYGHSR